MADGNGLATALRMLNASGVVADGGGEQDDLFEGDAPLPLAPAERGVSGPKGGRPTGARNRSTEEWCKLLLSRYRSPLTVLAEIYSRPLEQLVEHMQALADKSPTVVDRDGVVMRQVIRINPLDVLKLQRDAAVALAPYLHKAQPKALEIDSKPRGVMILGEISDAQPGDDDTALPLPPQ